MKTPPEELLIWSGDRIERSGGLLCASGATIQRPGALSKPADGVGKPAEDLLIPSGGRIEGSEELLWVLGAVKERSGALSTASEVVPKR